jgi:large subunit ribosomal protein L13
MKDLTTTPTKENTGSKWHFINAEGQILGRAAVSIAKKLTGKENVIFSPHLNVGDKVVVINAEKIKVTGKKLTDKLYIWHTRYPKGLRSEKLGDVLEKKPEEALRRAVKNMLPNNKLRKERLANLFIYKGAEHPHKAQEIKKENQ